MKPSAAICVLALAGLLVSCSSVEVEVSQNMQAGPHSVEQGEGGPRIFQNPLPVTPRAQEGSLSCWAACTEMVVEFLGGGRIRQCQQASLAFGIPASAHTQPSTLNPDGVPTCCNTDGTLVKAGDCDKSWYPEFDRWGFGSQLRFKALAWEELTTEIDEGRPFIFAWNEGDINHLLVAIGYHEDDGDRRVIYIDPFLEPVHPPVMAAFDQYYGNWENFPHVEDFVQVQRRTSP